MPKSLRGFDVDAFVRNTLAEDIGDGDITSESTIPSGTTFSGKIAAREGIVLAGIALVEHFFRALNPSVRLTRLHEDGERVLAGEAVLELSGDARALLAAERSALNTLQHLTGIATLTRVYADRIAGTGCVLLDTRKTLPGLRVLEKYASHQGGAQNHRMGLHDAVLIKDNHVAAAGGVHEAVSAAVAALAGRNIPVQVEVDRVEQIEPALDAGADRLLCDNMSLGELGEAVALVRGRVPIEASGGVRVDTIRSIAATGVNFVSVGRITQSAPAADIGLDFERSSPPRG
jgi:nicotinate-nucleotide pyrophosphorylase (carboxylating)